MKKRLVAAFLLLCAAGAGIAAAHSHTGRTAALRSREGLLERAADSLLARRAAGPGGGWAWPSSIQSIWKHRQALWRRGGFGRRAIGYLAVFQVALPLAAPLIDLFAIYSIVFLDPFPILGFWLAFNLFQLVIAWVSFGCDGESRRVLWALPLSQLVYRQVMYLVVIDAVISALMGTRLSWKRVKRTGDVRIAGQPS